MKIKNHQQPNESLFIKRYVGCLILTNDNKILLQQRAADNQHFPGYISTFGGQIETDETPLQTLIMILLLNCHAISYFTIYICLLSIHYIYKLKTSLE